MPAHFPSGDTPVYVNAVARLGHSAGFIGAVGQDGFGRCILNRFAEQGVDATHVRVLPDRTTGIAFVSYASDGSRQFIFHWREAAAGQIGPDYVPERVLCRRHLAASHGGQPGDHGCLVPGVSAGDEAHCRAGARVSFDPNIRREWLNDKIRHQWQPIIAARRLHPAQRRRGDADAGAEDDDAACRQLAAQGKVVLQKRGAFGCQVFATARNRSPFRALPCPRSIPRVQATPFVPGLRPPCSTTWICAAQRSSPMPWGRWR